MSQWSQAKKGCDAGDESEEASGYSLCILEEIVVQHGGDSKESDTSVSNVSLS